LFELLLLSAKPKLKHFNAVIERLNIVQEVLERIIISLVKVPIVVIVAPTDVEDVLNGFSLFFCEFT